MSAKFTLPENKKIPELEKEVLEFWNENKIFEKSVEERPKDNSYIFYDGPPFISGLPHPGHLLGSVAKDLIPRYWTMKGKRVERVWGWDAHGLTVENKVQDRLDIKHRRDIENYGLEEFTEACYDYTSEISSEWDWYIDRIGRWADLENAYRTTDQTYMESVFWAFKQLYEKGLIYKGIRTSLYCTVCGTPVSDFEIAMDNSYKEVEDPAVIVKFKIKDAGRFEGVNMLAWTTTPWTIPSNRALVVDPGQMYSLVEYASDDYVTASPLVETVFEDRDYKVRDEFLGIELIGLSYQPPYDFYGSNEKDFKVYSYEEMVNMEEGTGVVHSAPGFGDVDTEMGRHYDLTLMLTLNSEGHFKPGDAGENPFEGDFYKKANKLIRKDLKHRDLLFSDKTLTHRVPYHDRCDTVLIHRAQSSWFMDIQEIKEDMLENAKNINWVPSDIKEGRFKHIIETAPDWCISRNRFWATPMPVWESEGGERIIVGSIEELEDLSGQKVKNLHRPYIDEITIEKDGKVYKRIPEVLDSWFEAGSMPYAQFHYPFENKEKFEQNFPADYVVEYVAQVRAWFNVMHRLSTAIFDSHAFKNAICNGVMAGSDGRKMSKTYGNYTDPKKLLKTLGGDAFRLWLMNSPLMVGGNAGFEESEIKVKQKNVLNLLWNSLRYFVMYANKFEWELSQKEEDSSHIMDIWIKTRLEDTKKTVSQNIEKYIVPPAVQALEDFVSDLSRWYIRRSRNRISNGDNEALSTLYEVLLQFAKIAAPTIPFMTESIYQVLKDPKDPISIHLCMFPEFDNTFFEKNKDVLIKMESDREVVSKVLAVRDKEGIGLRQPLSDFVTKKSVNYPEVVKKELNIKEIIRQEVDNSLSANYIVGEDELVALNTEITEELEIEGEKRNVIRNLQKERKKAGLGLSQKITATIPDTELHAKLLDRYNDEISKDVAAVEIKLGAAYGVEEI